MLRDVAAKRRHVEGSPNLFERSFRGHVRYIINVMIADLTSSCCSTLRPQAHENTDPTFIFIPTAHFLFLLLRECLLAGASLCIRKGCTKVFRGASRLSESEHGPLVTDVSLLRTPLSSKPHIGSCITQHYDLLEANMTYYKDMKSW